jgi:hypothetical protein
MVYITVHRRGCVVPTGRFRVTASSRDFDNVSDTRSVRAVVLLLQALDCARQYVLTDVASGIANAGPFGSFVNVIRKRAGLDERATTRGVAVSRRK